jgi:hypothetical protein
VVDRGDLMWYQAEAMFFKYLPVITYIVQAIVWMFVGMCIADAQWTKNKR